jgi:formamidopyrimidine-DNA glycosylase
MPELPEVETIKRDLSRLIVGAKILDIETDTPKMVQPSLSVVKKAVVGKRVLKIKRRAKLIIIALGSDLDEVKVTLKAQRTTEKTEFFLVVHLKLTGRLLVRKPSDPPDDWQHVAIKLKAKSAPASPRQSRGRAKRKSRKLELRFCDLRKFGWIRLVTNKELGIMSQELGPEPLDDLDLKEFKKILASTRRAVKIVLMDQKKISGVGNIYANDALFLARIKPDKPAQKLRNEEIKKLWKALTKVLEAGIKYRGASDQYYLDALGQKGSYQDHFLVYGRDGKKCFGCQGKVKRIKIGGRGTFYCPACQP